MSVASAMDLDDLASFEGSDSGMRTPQYPGSPRAPLYNPVGLTIGEVSSSRGNLAHSVHGVHMHTHENTKIPLLNQAVDRTNSSISVYPTAANDGADFSMAELFLSKESKFRQSLARNYEGLGGFLEDIELGMSTRRPSGSSTATSEKAAAAAAVVAESDAQMEIEALTAVDPTPWSEIEQKISIAHHVNGEPSTVSHPHQYNYYPYGRQHQLPIPNKAPSPPRHAIDAVTQNSEDVGESQATTMSVPVPLQKALETAAQLASVGVTETIDEKPATSGPPMAAAPSAANSAPIPNPISLHTVSSTTYSSAEIKPSGLPSSSIKHEADNPSRTAGAPQSYHRQRATYTPPQHASAHTTSRASVLAAASKKAQYGFGGNHVVPSVPAPPPTASTRALQKNMPRTLLVPAPSSEASTNNSGAAYERKKQRAKDARVRLNESIERLSIAMNLAGSQSKHRLHLLNTRVSQTEHRPKSLHITEECSKLAEQAKKWDRPSFVGTAASIVQVLNSQCDALSRELLALQERLNSATGMARGVPGTTPSPPEMAIDQKQKRMEPPDAQITESPSKRSKKEDNNDNDPRLINGAAPSYLFDEKVLKDVSTMLDPASLANCMSVSKRWKTQFDNDDVWFQLAVKRFGFYNVRQWAEKLEDTDPDSIAGLTTKKALYRAMSSANVMPYIQHLSGLTFLGSAKIPGRVGGWVYMVERSNGETLRSVRQEPTTDSASGTSSYQSRPVVELRIVIQNTGMAKSGVVIRPQQFAVDTSTRRSGGELKEIDWDDRFSKSIKSLYGAMCNNLGAKNNQVKLNQDDQGELCRLALYESAEITFHVDAKGCSTTSKFRQKSNFTKVLISLEGTTIPMVIPFLREGSC